MVNLRLRITKAAVASRLQVTYSLAYTIADLFITLFTDYEQFLKKRSSAMYALL